MDFYDVLNISSNADTTEIEKAFRALSLKYHPDKANLATVPPNGEIPSERQAREQQNHERFIEIATARDTLADPLKRQEYDRKRRSSQNSGRNVETRAYYAYDGAVGTSSQHAGYWTDNIHAITPTAHRAMFKLKWKEGLSSRPPKSSKEPSRGEGRAGPAPIGELSEEESPPCWVPITEAESNERADDILRSANAFYKAEDLEGLISKLNDPEVSIPEFLPTLRSSESNLDPEDYESLMAMFEEEKGRESA
ncbi:DnaJ domain-containing protein [Nemania sp. FL0031]|nr:DnaJ domain-containing protein [Nemania sp. FL0031]